MKGDALKKLKMYFISCCDLRDVLYFLRGKVGSGLELSVFGGIT